MKKFLLSLVSLFMLTLFAVAGEPTKALTFPAEGGAGISGYLSEWTATVGEDAWTIYGFNTNKNGWDYVRCGRKGVAHTGTITSPAVNAAITDVVITVDKTSNVEKATLTVLNGETTVKDIDVTEKFVAGDVDITVEGAAGYSYKLTIESDGSATANGTTQISKVALYEAGKYAEEELAEVANIAAFKALESGTEAKLTLKDAQVNYVSGDNVYIQDATGGLIVYKTGIEFTAGTSVNGTIIGKIGAYRGAPQLTSSANTANSEVTATALETLATETGVVAGLATAENLLKLYEYKEATIQEDGGKYYVVDGEEKVQIYDQFKVVTAWPEKVNFTAVLGIYNTTYELFPIADLEEVGSDEPTASVKMTYVDFDNPDTAIGEVTESKAGYNKISGGNVAFGNTGWACNWVTYIQVDASAYAGVVKNAKLSFDISGSTDSKRNTAWGVGYNSSAWSADLTYNTADLSITTLGETIASTQKSAATFETITFDITDAFADGKKVATILVYETAAAGGFIKNPTVEIEASDPEVTVGGVVYALKGDNLFKNGSFDNGVDGWKTVGYETDAVIDNFTYATEGGFDGGAYITTAGGGVGSEKTIRQSVAVEPGKTYYFTVYTSGKAPASNNFNYNALFQMTDATTENGVIKAFEWPQGADQTSETWSQTKFVFTAAEGNPFVGVRMGWNSGSSFDGFALYEAEMLTSELEAAKATAIAALEALTPVGDGLFQYSEAAIAEAKTAIEAATTVEEVNAVELPVATAPDAEQAYSIVNTTAAGNLGITTEKVSIIAGAAVYFTAVEGGFAISNADGEYIAKKSGDTWSFTTSTDIASAYVVTVNPVEGGYTLQGANGLFGTDATDEGAIVYANKAQSNNGLWAIEENDFPGAVDMTSLIKNPAYLEKGEDGTANYAGWTHSENAWKARNYDAPMNLITYSGNAAFEVSQTIESVPAGHYMLTVHAFYRAGSLDDEKAKIAAGTELEKELSFYAEVAGEKTSEKVMNLSEGATEKNYSATKNTQLENGLYVPNSADDARDWYIAKEYNNALEFDVYEDGPVTIGLSKTEGLAGDYCPIGGWHLIRLGDAEAPAGITYAGVIEQTLTHPEQGEMGSTTTEQTLVITEAGEDLVNITFSGFTFPVLPFSVPSFTVENVAVETAEDGTITYAAGNFVVGIPMGMMTANYNATLEGEQANADATPVIKIVLQNATTDTAIFGADQDAIDAYKKAHEEAQEPTAPEAPAFAELSTDGSTPQYLYNVEAKAFYLGANDWGTRASVAADKGYAVKITLNEGGNGTYNLEDQLANGNWNSADCQAVDQIWIDGSGRPGDKMWTVTAAEGLTFKLGNTNVADGFLAVVPSKGDTRLYISAEEGAQDVWAAVSEEEYNKYIEAYAEYLAELDEWNKTHYEVGDDIIALTPAAWDGQTGTYGGLAGTSYERYSASGSIDEGDVLTQTLEGLKNGTYEVKLELAASYTAGRGFECPTGNGLAVAFANETERNLAVVDRTWVSDGEQKVITLTAVVTDGTLKYGIKNITAAGNWYVANVLSLVYTSEEAEEATTYTIEIAEAENGTVTTDVAADEEGSRVFITATPEEGYEIDAITVTDAEGTAIEVTANNAFTMPAGKVTVTVTFKSSIPDAINGINATSTLKNGKYLENNKVVIIRNGVKYGVNGAAIK
ncbi:MAG: hypothetical protein IJ635_12170 [Bacteroidaceae bacterium]|nr:hypothetical protein [Bacteroidaceae bacterium]